VIVKDVLLAAVIGLLCFGLVMLWAGKRRWDRPVEPTDPVPETPRQHDGGRSGGGPAPVPPPDGEH
jgi:hypothetical protein